MGTMGLTSNESKQLKGARDKRSVSPDYSPSSPKVG